MRVEELKNLIIGYGNVDRQDDGVAWHILHELCKTLKYPCPSSFEEPFDIPGESLKIIFSLQLVPEVAEEVARFDRICFVDAHTGAIEEDLSFKKISPEFQGSPFTHHMTPQMCMKLAHQLYNAHAQAWLLSVRGYQFGFGNELSSRTQNLADKAVSHLTLWLTDLVSQQESSQF